MSVLFHFRSVPTAKWLQCCHATAAHACAGAKQAHARLNVSTLRRRGSHEISIALSGTAARPPLLKLAASDEVAKPDNRDYPSNRSQAASARQGTVRRHSQQFSAMLLQYEALQSMRECPMAAQRGASSQSVSVPWDWQLQERTYFGTYR